MNNPLLDKTSPRLKFLLRAPVQTPTDADIEDWQTSPQFRHDHEMVSAVGRQLKLDDGTEETMWELIGDPFVFHIETVVKAPAPEMFDHAATLIAQESFVGCDEPELVALFIANGWQDFTPKVSVGHFEEVFKLEAERRTARSIRQMLDRWHVRNCWSIQWRKRLPVVDLREREERRQRRLAGDRPFEAPAVPDARRT